MKSRSHKNIIRKSKSKKRSNKNKIRGSKSKKRDGSNFPIIRDVLTKHLESRMRNSSSISKNLRDVPSSIRKLSPIKSSLIPKISKSRKTSNCKMNIILDLDEMLGHHIKLHKWEEIPDEDKEKYEYLYFPIEKKNFVLRPYVREFVDYLFDHFNVGIFTAGGRDYAKWIADKILINGHLDRHVNIVLWSTHDKFARRISKHNYGKDLQYLWIDEKYDDKIDPNIEDPDEYYNAYSDERDHPILLHNFYPCNTILIDDNQANATNKRNHMNSIHVQPFSFFGHKKNQPYKPQYNDTVLLDVIPVLEKVRKLQEKNICSEKHFATCAWPDIGRKGRVFDNEEFEEYYRTHDDKLPHVCIGEGEGAWYTGAFK